jgi:hypothetical protein
VTVERKLNATLDECRTHARILAEARKELRGVRYDAERVLDIKPSELGVLDQMAYRFSKLQDSVGEKVLPLLLDFAEEPLSPTATFAEKLQRLEKIGAITSAEQWRLLREVRNQLAHEYPDLPAIKAAVLNRFLDSIDQLGMFWTHVQKWAVAHRPKQDSTQEGESQ